MNNVSILFSWHKCSEEFIKRDNFLPRKKLLTSETNCELKRIFNSYQHYSKKCVIDGFLSLHCLKCVPINQHASEKSLDSFRSQNVKDLIPLS